MKKLGKTKVELKIESSHVGDLIMIHSILDEFERWEDDDDMWDVFGGKLLEAVGVLLDYVCDTIPRIGEDADGLIQTMKSKVYLLEN